MALLHPLRPDQSRSLQDGIDPIARADGSVGCEPPRLVRVTGLVLADVVAFCTAVGCGCAAANGVATWRLEWTGSLPHFATSLVELAALLVGVVLYLAGRAHYGRRLPFWTQLRLLVSVSLVALLCNGFFEFLTRQHASRTLVVTSWLLFPWLAVLLRTGAKRLLDAAGLWRIPVIIVGAGQAGRDAYHALRSEPGLGYDIVGTVSPVLLELSHARQNWGEVLRRFQAELLVLATDQHERPHRDVIESMVRERVPLAVMPQLDGLPVLGAEQTAFFSHDTMLVSYRNNLARPVARGAKVAFDVAASSLGLLVLAPLLLIVAALVKLDGGPVLFGHMRIGAGGRRFRCLKFRSMVPDSEAVLLQRLQDDPAAAAEWASTRKLRDDPRITWIGRILRKSSLDELPQLLNVLRLEMSLVGPRPIVSEEVSRYGEDIAYYYETRPGLTGLWQVSGRSDTSYAHRVQLDSWYVRNWSIWHDLAIIAKTIPAVLKSRGAV